MIEFLSYADIIYLELDSLENSDIVYLKNGKVRRGLILEKIPGESVKLETNYGEIFVIKMPDISSTRC